MGLFQWSAKDKKCIVQSAPLFEYDHLPETFRAKVLYLWSDANPMPIFWEQLSQRFIRQKGFFGLGANAYELDNVNQYFLSCDTASALELMELIFHTLADQVAGVPTFEESEQLRSQSTEHGAVYSFALYDIKALLAQLNALFNEYKLGYQYLNGKITRRDDEYTHDEIIAPAMTLLLDSRFEGAAQEFSVAHEHYRAGRTKECITECNKAFESTMKAICDSRKWKYEKTAQAKSLIDILVKNGLLGPEQSSFFGALRSLLESGVPTLRNKQSAHGQGKTILDVPQHVAQYALNLTAANILFLAGSSNRK